jgi:penicillin amidase
MGRGFTPLAPDGFEAFRRTGHVTRLLREQPDGWLDRPWEEAIADALDAVARWLHERFADDPRSWAWGRVRPLRFLHPAGRRRLLEPVFNLRVPGFGDSSTVAQAAVSLIDPTSTLVVVPGLRMVVDVGKWERSRWALPGGQSGNPCSPHYDDQLGPWRRAAGIRVPWNEEEVRGAARHTLTVQPSRGPATGIPGVPRHGAASRGA